MSFYEDASWLLIPSGIEEDVVFAQKPTSGLGDLTFTRASDATYTDSTGVVRRSPYNLLQQSEEFENVYWTKINTTVTANSATSPNNTTTAELLTVNSGSTQAEVSRTLTTITGQSYVFSFFGKKGSGATELNSFRIAGVGAINTVTINWDTGIISQTGSGATSQSFGDGWYRIIIPFVANSTSSILQLVTFQVYPAGVSSYRWGAQLVEGTEALDYFPTTNRQDVPRIDFRNADGTLSSCGRLLLEPQRTNSIRNSSMVGAVAGTPGTLPTNYAQGGGGGAVTTRTIVGTGTENGLPYIDIRYQGNTAGQLRLITESGAIAAATVGSVYTNSTYIKLVSGTAPQIQLVISNRDASNNFIGDNNGPLFNLSSTLTRYAYTATIAQAGTAFAQPLLQWAFAATAYDFTIRIAAPQMELGPYATTWIPTTTAAVTRLVDSAIKTGVSSLIGQTEGTLFLDFESGANDSGVYWFGINNNTSASRIAIFRSSTNTLIGNVRISGSTQAQISSVVINQNSRYKCALAYSFNDIVFYINGTQIGVDTSALIPACDTITTDDGGGASQFARPVNEAALFPTRLTNAQLAELTTL